MTDNKPTYHHGDVPQALMAAALQRIKSDGVEKLSLRALARDIGVSQSAPYRHFKDKTELLVKLACEGFYKLSQYDQEKIHGPDPLENLINVGIGYIRFAMKNPEQYHLMFGSKISCRREHEQLTEAGQQAFGVILDKTTEGVESQFLLDQDPFMLAKSCWAKVHGLASLAIDGFFDNLEAELDDFLREQVVLGIRGIVKDPDAIKLNKIKGNIKPGD